MIFSLAIQPQEQVDHVRFARPGRGRRSARRAPGSRPHGQHARPGTPASARRSSSDGSGGLRSGSASTAARASSTAPGHLGLGQPEVSRAEGHVLLHGGGEELIGRILKDHADLPIEFGRRQRRHVGAAQANVSLLRADQPHEDFMSVVLPAPLAPITATNSPGRRGRSRRPGPRCRRDRRSRSRRPQWPVWAGRVAHSGHLSAGRTTIAMTATPAAHNAQSRLRQRRQAGDRQRRPDSRGRSWPRASVRPDRSIAAGRCRPGCRANERAAKRGMAQADLLGRQHAGGLLEEREDRAEHEHGDFHPGVAAAAPNAGRRRFRGLREACKARRSTLTDPSTRAADQRAAPQAPSR